MVEILPVFVGAVIGFLVGFTSMGGGALLTPALVLIVGIPTSVAIGTDLLIAAVTKLFGAIVFAYRKEVHWQTVFRLAFGSVPGALVGIGLIQIFPVEQVEGILVKLLGAILIVAGVSTMVRSYFYNRSHPAKMPTLRLTIVLGFFTGLMVSLTSIGSGSLLLFILTLFFPIRAQSIVGTDVVHALLITGVASFGHFFSGTVDLELAGWVLLGSIPGVLLGSQMILHFPARKVRTFLTYLLILVGIYMVAFRSS